MGKFTVSRKMAHRVDDVWSAIEDFGGIHRFSAGVESSPINEGKPTRGVGAERNCQLYDGNHIQERVTEAVTNQRLEVEVFETSMPIKRADAIFALEATPDGGCEVGVTMDYIVKFGIVGKAMDALMMQAMMTKSMTNLLAALDHHLATGEAIEKGWKPAQAA